MQLDIPLSKIDSNDEIFKSNHPIYVVCRRGNDSQLAVEKLLEMGIACKDIKGGLEAWSLQVDSSFPRY